MKFLITILLLCSMASAQMLQSITNDVHHVAGTSITSNIGGTGVGQLDGGGDADIPIAIPIILPFANPTFDGNVRIYWDSPVSMTWGGALWNDNGNTPAGGSKVCGAITTSTPTNDVYTTLAMTGCPGTLTGSAGTVYWLSVYTHSNTPQYGTSGTNDHCPGTAFGAVGPAASHDYTGGWPSTYPAISGTPATAIGGCYAVYIQLGYSSSAAYNLISLNPMNFDLGVPTAAGHMAPITSGHGLVVISEGDGTSGVVTSVKTTTGGANTDTLTKVSCSTATTPTKEWCFWQIDRATAGADGVTCVFTNTGGSYKVGCEAMEIQGTLASGSVDKHANDTAYIATQSFTAANSTATTTQASEYWIGYDYDGWNQSQGNTALLSANGGGWTILQSGESTGNSPSLHGIYTQVVSSTGTCTLQGTSNGGAASNNHVPGCLTLK